MRLNKLNILAPKLLLSLLAFGALVEGLNFFMTKDEAIEQMKKGLKVTHRYFKKNEYVRMRQYGFSMITDSSIYWLSDKHKVSARMFWHDRKGEHWNDGWEIFNN